MRHLVALVACFAFTGSIAHARPGERAKRHGKVDRKAKAKVEVARAEERARQEEDDEEREEDERDGEREEDGRDEERDERDGEREEGDRRAKRVAAAIEGSEEEDAEIYFYEGDEEDEGEEEDEDVGQRWRDDGEDRWRDGDERGERGDRRGRRTKARRGRGRAKPWHVAVGPYLWASSVDANVSLGKASVSTGVDFMEIKRHARYGVTALAEVRYGRFTIYGDMMYGVIALDGAREVGPFMVKLDGTVSSLMVDAAAGYRVAGVDPRARLSLEARVGLRYQRTAIDGSVNVAGADVSNPSYVDAAADALAGAQVVARPFGRLTVAGTFDVGVYGVSTRTWSAAADASWRVSQRLLLSLGWRTLTTERPNVSIVMHGPRGALQLMF